MLVYGYNVQIRRIKKSEKRFKLYIFQLVDLIN